MPARPPRTDFPWSSADYVGRVGRSICCSWSHLCVTASLLPTGIWHFGRIFLRVFFGGIHGLHTCQSRSMCAAFHAPILCIVCCHLPPVAYGQGSFQSCRQIKNGLSHCSLWFLPWCYRDCGCIHVQGSGRSPCTDSQLHARWTRMLGHSALASGCFVMPTPASGAASAAIDAMSQLLVE